MRAKRAIISTRNERRRVAWLAQVLHSAKGAFVRMTAQGPVHLGRRTAEDGRPCMS